MQDKEQFVSTPTVMTPRLSIQHDIPHGNEGPTTKQESRRLVDNKARSIATHQHDVFNLVGLVSIDVIVVAIDERVMVVMMMNGVSLSLSRCGQPTMGGLVHAFLCFAALHNTLSSLLFPLDFVCLC